MLTIITPVYNGDRFIESCIKVVIEQNCPDIEHLIIDGGSEDKTLEIIQKYAKKYSHLRWISEKDRGQSDALNKGIALANGEILNILNVDDYYEPNVLNKAIAYFQHLPEPSLLVANCNVWGNSGRLLTVNRPKKLQLADLLKGLHNPYPFNPSAYFYHRSLHNIIGDYNLEDHYSMDLDFILRAVQVANIKYVDEIWGNWRKITGTKTFEETQNGNNLKRVFQVYKIYLKDLPLFPRTMAIIQQFLLKIMIKLYLEKKWYNAER